MKTSERASRSETNAHQPSRLELTTRGEVVRGLGFTGLATLMLTVGFTYLNHEATEARAGGVTEAPTDQTITELLIEDGANLRSDPHTGNKDFPNRLSRVDLGDARYIAIPTENGVYVASDENGTWYGIESENLIDSLDVNVEDGEDGIIWVNEDRAEALPSNNIDPE